MRLFHKFNFMFNFHIRESNYKCPPKEDFSSFRLFFSFYAQCRQMRHFPPYLEIRFTNLIADKASKKKSKQRERLKIDVKMSKYYGSVHSCHKKLTHELTKVSVNYRRS